MLLVVVRLFIDTQNRLVALHSAIIKAHEETDNSPHPVIYRSCSRSSSIRNEKKERNNTEEIRRFLLLVQ
jgi:hypothetical protein